MAIGAGKNLRLFVLLVFLCAGLGCNFVTGMFEEGSAPVSPPAGAVDTAQLTGSRELPVARSDKKTFKPEQFAARTLPVQVTFTGEEEAGVVFQGALAYPNWNKSAQPPDALELFLVFQVNDAPLVHRDGDELYSHYWNAELVIHLFDAGGGELASLERNMGAFDPNFPQPFRVYIDEIPGGAARVAVDAALVKRMKSASCFAGSEGYQLPDPMFLHSPITLSLNLDDWSEAFARKSVVADYNLVYQNPYNQELAPRSLILFLDEAGGLVGYMDHDVVIPAGGAYSRRSGEPWQSSYLSGLPASALIFDDIPICTLFEASK